MADSLVNTANTINNLLLAKVVLAKSSVVTASEKENSDLF
jgi:hypothetical protein